MTVTAELITKVRKLTGEPILPEGTEADTRFTDVEISEFIADASSVNNAIADVWEAKAGLFQAEIGSVKSVGAAQETTQWYTPKEQADFCFNMAKQYREKAVKATAFGCRVR
jgi:hypothetical protein